MWKKILNFNESDILAKFSLIECKWIWHNALLHFCRSEDDADSEIEETIYSHVHYASSLLVSEKSTPGMNFSNWYLLIIYNNDNKGFLWWHIYWLIALYNTLWETLTRLHWALHNFLRKFCRCPQFQNQGQITTSRATIL